MPIANGLAVHIESEVGIHKAHLAGGRIPGDAIAAIRQRTERLDRRLLLPLQQGGGAHPKGLWSGFQAKLRRIGHIQKFTKIGFVMQACANGKPVDPDSFRCSDNGARVDLSSCATNDSTGAAELKAIWQDPTYKQGESAAYYIRALENPKCRWSTWDAVRNGTPPNPDMQATLQDRAWGSPIWVAPSE